MCSHFFASVFHLGYVVYETDGKNLHDFNVFQFERTHGSVKNYHRNLLKEDLPFPFRAWLVSAIGIPLGLFLFFVFILKAYTAVFYGEEEKRQEAERPASNYETRLERVIGGVTKFNIFVIAILVFLAVISIGFCPT